MTNALVLKLGGELLESASGLDAVTGFATRVTPGRPLVVVHGGGRAIDVELARRQITPRRVDGLRVTDRETLDAVVAVLAGSVNAGLVAAFVSHGVRAVGLTGADSGFGRATRISAYVTSSGETEDLGLVGDPATPGTDLLDLLLGRQYVPVVASLGIDTDSDRSDTGLLNVNADVMACRIAAALGGDLVIAGSTAGVLDSGGLTVPELDIAGIDRLVENGTATAGMLAKLTACRVALESGVRAARIVDGRAFASARGLDDLPGTTLVTADSVVEAQ